jgi:hypothetical protein
MPLNALNVIDPIVPLCINDDAGRLGNIRIAVSNELPSPGLGDPIDDTTAACTYQPDTLGDAEYTFVCDSPVVGRFLSIQRMEAGLLALCEVEVLAALSGARTRMR